MSAERSISGGSRGMAEARGVAAQFIWWSTSLTAQMTERLCDGTTSGDAPAGFDPSIAEYQGRPSFRGKVLFEAFHSISTLLPLLLTAHCPLHKAGPLCPYVKQVTQIDLLPCQWIGTEPHLLQNICAYSEQERDSVINCHCGGHV